MDVVSNPEYSEEQFANSRLLVNVTCSSICTTTSIVIGLKSREQDCHSITSLYTLVNTDDPGQHIKGATYVSCIGWHPPRLYLCLLIPKFCIYIYYYATILVYTTTEASAP